jgi:hypothetical protein
VTVPFALTKWYVDVVDDDGCAAIAYWASVRVAGVAHAVGGLLVSRDGGLADRTLTLHGAGAPTWRGDHLSWHSPSLHLSVDADRLMGAFSQQLLTTPSGTMDWHCDAPLARVRFAVGSDVIEGRGYIERLQLGIAPWALPAMRILWGRWTGPGRSVVWIAWEGAHPLRLVWVDGTLVADAVPTTDRVVLGARGSLTLHDHSVITDATVGEQLTPLQPLRAIVDRVAHQRQTRWRARGTLQEPGREDVSGWVVHEVVQWH